MTISRYTPLTDSQGYIVAITPMITGILSAICSSKILFLIYSEAQAKFLSDRINSSAVVSLNSEVHHHQYNDQQQQQQQQSNNSNNASNTCSTDNSNNNESAAASTKQHKNKNKTSSSNNNNNNNLSNNSAMRRITTSSSNNSQQTSSINTNIIKCRVFHIFKNYTSVYDRIIAGMSMIDIVNSISLALSTLPTPKSEPFGYISIGNTTSCQVQGYLFQLGMSVMFYNCSLCFYFLLTLQDDDSKVSQRAEVAMHSVPLLFGVLSATICLFTYGYHMAYVHCWISPYPEGCVYLPEDNIIECEVSPHAILAQTLFSGMWIVLVYLFLLRTMLMIYNNVKKLERALGISHYKIVARQAAKVAFFYIAAFMVTFSPASFSILAYGLDSTKKITFPIILLIQLTYPSQGVLNYFVFHYRRTAGLKLRRQIEEELGIPVN